MSLLGNIIWLIFGGLYAAVGYAVAGIVLCLTVVGLPFGIAQLRLARAGLMPFGGRVVTSPEAHSPLYLLMNIVWLIVYGWALVLGHLFFALVLAVTIVGLPFAKQHLKLIPIAAMPFGRTFVFG
jgi:uncharacterized membrane protein YccF (DUF307 family)